MDVLNDESGSLAEAQSKDEFCQDVKRFLEGRLPPGTQRRLHQESDARRQRL